MISEVQELVKSLNQLFDKATEASVDSDEESSAVPNALATFARETHSKLNNLVESSFQVLEENDPRPLARQVRKAELGKVIKKEVQKGKITSINKIPLHRVGALATLYAIEYPIIKVRIVEIIAIFKLER